MCLIDGLRFLEIGIQGEPLLTQIIQRNRVVIILQWPILLCSLLMYSDGCEQEERSTFDQNHTEKSLFCWWRRICYGFAILF